MRSRAKGSWLKPEMLSSREPLQAGSRRTWSRQPVSRPESQPDRFIHNHKLGNSSPSQVRECRFCSGSILEKMLDRAHRAARAHKDHVAASFAHPGIVAESRQQALLHPALTLYPAQVFAFALQAKVMFNRHGRSGGVQSGFEIVGIGSRRTRDAVVNVSFCLHILL